MSYICSWSGIVIPVFKVSELLPKAKQGRTGRSKLSTRNECMWRPLAPSKNDKRPGSKSSKTPKKICILNK